MLNGFDFVAIFTIYALTDVLAMHIVGNADMFQEDEDGRADTGFS
jgi:hypothetical protein